MTQQERDDLKQKRSIGNKHSLTYRAVHDAAEAIQFGLVNAKTDLELALERLNQEVARAAHIAAGGDPDESRRDKWIDPTKKERTHAQRPSRQLSAK